MYLATPFDVAPAGQVPPRAAPQTFSFKQSYMGSTPHLGTLNDLPSVYYPIGLVPRDPPTALQQMRLNCLLWSKLTSDQQVQTAWNYLYPNVVFLGNVSDTDAGGYQGNAPASPHAVALKDVRNFVAGVNAYCASVRAPSNVIPFAGRDALAPAGQTAPTSAPAPTMMSSALPYAVGAAGGVAVGSLVTWLLCRKKK